MPPHTLSLGADRASSPCWRRRSRQGLGEAALARARLRPSPIGSRTMTRFTPMTPSACGITSSVRDCHRVASRLAHARSMAVRIARKSAAGSWPMCVIRSLSSNSACSAGISGMPSINVVAYAYAGVGRRGKQRQRYDVGSSRASLPRTRPILKYRTQYPAGRGARCHRGARGINAQSCSPSNLAPRCSAPVLA
jgi:hypothetical protein